MVRVVRLLVVNGMEPRDISVLTPYTGQVRAARQELSDRGYNLVEVCSIDGFQVRATAAQCMK